MLSLGITGERYRLLFERCWGGFDYRKHYHWKPSDTRGPSLAVVLTRSRLSFVGTYF